VLEPARLGEIGGEPLLDLRQERHERAVFGQFFEALLADQTKQADGVMLGSLPRIQVDPSEQLDGMRVPTPTQVHRDAQEWLQSSGQRSPNCEAT
jgi:hypothetical protein